jgi:RNA polymerase sigma-70 factor (ECF subfamily)
MIERMDLEFSDRELIGEIRTGSAVAFERLMRRYEKLVYKVAYGLTGEREGALDVVQNVFLRVHSKLSTYRAEGDLRNWILRIAANESMNWNRSRKRHRAVELNEGIPGGPPSPQEDLFSRRERWKLLRQALFSLNPKHRLALVLRYFEGMPVREIAGVLECSEGVAKNILFRGLKKLKAELAPSAEIPT